MKRRIIVGVVAVTVVAIAAAAAWRFRPRDEGTLLSGTIEVRDVQVGSLVGGRVSTVHVEEGQDVAAGQTLVSLEPDLLDPQIREQEGHVAEAQSRLALVLAGPRREETARAQAQSELAERERQRLEPLRDQGVIPAQQYDAAATDARTALESYRELARGSRPEDVATARATLKQAEERLAYLRRQREEAVVKSPVAGRIEVFDLRPGDIVAPNQPVATVLEPDQIWVRVYVPEPKFGLVRVGQRARVRVDTFPGRDFAGKVVEIRTRAEYTPRNIQTIDQRQDQVFGVKVLIDPVPELKPGMAALVRLES